MHNKIYFFFFSFFSIFSSTYYLPDSSINFTFHLLPHNSIPLSSIIHINPDRRNNNNNKNPLTDSSSKPTPISIVVKTHDPPSSKPIKTHTDQRKRQRNPQPPNEREKGSLQRAWGLGFEKSREQRVDEKERRKREKRREIMREQREISGLKRRKEGIKNYYFVLKWSYNAILKVELHCNTIANFFFLQQLSFRSLDETWFLCYNGKTHLHMPFSVANALSCYIKCVTHSFFF